MVVMVGVDVHKDTHCAVAVDEVGRQIGTARTFRTTDAGCLQLLRWAQHQAHQHAGDGGGGGGGGGAIIQRMRAVFVIESFPFSSLSR